MYNRNDMEYSAVKKNEYTVLTPHGDIKTTDAASFEMQMQTALDDNEYLMVDLGEVGYISSSGLRALLAIQQRVDETEKGDLLITNIGEEVMRIFRSTGFHNVLTIR